MPPSSRSSDPGDEAGFERLGPPARGEWRRVVPEPAQSLAAYLQEGPAAGPLTLFPLGGVSDRHAELLDRAREYASLFFQTEVRLGSPLPLFEDAHVPQRDQYNSSMLLGELAEGGSGGAGLGITDRDLFARGVSYVFGESSAEKRTGVLSIARLGSPDSAAFRRRALKLLTHEAGHLFRIAHCRGWRCVMQGANTLEESDRHPMHLCPDDLRKLRWIAGFDVQERYRKLKAFYQAEGWLEEAGWVSDRLRS